MTTVVDDRTLIYDVVSAPIGRLIVASDGGAIAAVWMANANPRDASWSERRASDAVLAEAREQLTAYFAGNLRAFTLPLAPNGTEFQRRVWRELEAIPFGTTVTYAEIAR